MKKLLILFLIVMLSARSFAQQKTDQNIFAINRVLNTFMQSIIKKDTTTLYSLFANNVPIGWIDIPSKETFLIAKKTNPNAAMVESDTHTNFIRYVGKTKDAVEEKFYNVKIRNDGLLASISFDYSFWANGKKENWGQENWEMVYDGTDWKIAGVYYSYILEKTAREPGERN